VSANLILHKGASLVTLEQLREFRAPEPEGRWYPIAHCSVLEAVKGTLGEAGYQVRTEKLALNREGTRFFGTLDLETAVGPGVHLAVGIRNSTDKTFPLGFCAGNRVFVCDNLAFRSELLVKRKHTRYGEQRFRQAIAEAVTSLGSFQEIETARIKAMMGYELTAEQADSLILRSFEKGIISAPLLPRIIKEWREPSFEEFQPRTVWSLLNAFTRVLGERATTQPTKFAVQTTRLNNLLEPPRPGPGQEPQGEPVNALSA
jgi:hypothetical protein